MKRKKLTYSDNNPKKLKKNRLPLQDISNIITDPTEKEINEAKAALKVAVLKLDQLEYTKATLKLKNKYTPLLLESLQEMLQTDAATQELFFNNANQIAEDSIILHSALIKINKRKKPIRSAEQREIINTVTQNQQQELENVILTQDKTAFLALRNATSNPQIFAKHILDVMRYRRHVVSIDADNQIKLFQGLVNLACYCEITERALINFRSELGDNDNDRNLAKIIANENILNANYSQISQDFHFCVEKLKSITDINRLLEEVKNLFNNDLTPNNKFITVKFGEIFTAAKLDAETYYSEDKKIAGIDLSNAKLRIVINIAQHQFFLTNLISLINQIGQRTGFVLPELEDQFDHEYIFTHFFEKNNFYNNSEQILANLVEQNDYNTAHMLLLFAHHSPEFADHLFASKNYNTEHNFWQKTIKSLNELINQDSYFLCKLLINRENYLAFAEAYQNLWENEQNYFQDTHGNFWQSSIVKLKLCDDIELELPLHRSISRPYNQLFIGQINVSDDILKQIISYQKGLDGILLRSNPNPNVTATNTNSAASITVEENNWQLQIWQEPDKNSEHTTSL